MDESDVSVVPMYPPNTGAKDNMFGFYCLFHDKKKMQLWEEFTSCNELQQESILNGISQSKFHSSKQASTLVKSVVVEEGAFESEASTDEDQRNGSDSFVEDFEEITLNDFEGDDEIIIFSEKNLNEKNISALAEKKKRHSADDSSSDSSYDLVSVEDVDKSLENIFVKDSADETV